MIYICDLFKFSQLFSLAFVYALLNAKQLYAGHSVAKDPDADSTNTVDKILDETLGRLGVLDSKHPSWKSALNELRGTITQAELLKKTTP